MSFEFIVLIGFVLIMIGILEAVGDHLSRRQSLIGLVLCGVGNVFLFYGLKQGPLGISIEGFVDASLRVVDAVLG